MSWTEANQQYSLAALAQVRAMIVRFLGEETVADENPAPAMPESALETLCGAFGLSEFERKVLLMCAGAEWDSRLGTVLRERANFSLALAAFEGAHWSALSPSGPLRYWRLVHMREGEPITTAPLRIDERVLHYLAGLEVQDGGLRPLLRTVDARRSLAPSHESAAEQIAQAWRETDGVPPVIQLCGSDTADKREVAAAACRKLGLGLKAIAARQIPQTATELDLFRRLMDRDAILSASALLVECDDADQNDANVETAIRGLVENLRAGLVIAQRTARRIDHRSSVVVDTERPTFAEQNQIWREELSGDFPSLNGRAEMLAAQFSMGAAGIRSTVEQARRNGTGDPFSGLWEACRLQSRPRLEGLAQRIEARATWDDLVVRPRQRNILRQIAIHVRSRAQVYESWGFAAKSHRGLGISAMFAGPSGTGKTMAAEVLANDVRLDLYRIDLSQVVSKYIGETEKNLRRVFDAADEGAAILLFDEADALFGKRSDVKDSHDRYANIEVSYLLQRMEAYRGLAILTTNRKSALDQAFLRRIRFVVEFPFPDAEQRAEIWRRVFPRATPTEGLEIDRLARLNASGAHIANIAMGAAFLAADAGEPVKMPHLLAAARSEFEKQERVLTESEVAGWA